MKKKKREGIKKKTFPNPREWSKKRNLLRQIGEEEEEFEVNMAMNPFTLLLLQFSQVKE